MFSRARKLAMHCDTCELVQYGRHERRATPETLAGSWYEAIKHLQRSCWKEDGQLSENSLAPLQDSYLPAKWR